MTAIAYCYYLPEHDECGRRLPFPPHVLKWTGWEEGSDEPIHFGVVPYLINTSDPQVALRTIAQRLHEVVAVQMVRPKARAHISRLVMHAERLPLTFIATAYKPHTPFRGVAVLPGGLEVSTGSGGSGVLMASHVGRLQRQPFNKCVDQVAVHYVNDVITRRRNGERGLKFVKPATDWASVATVHEETLARVLRDHVEPSQHGVEYPLVDISSIKAVKLPPLAKPKGLPDTVSPPESYTTIPTQPAAPTRPPQERIPAHANADEPERPGMWWTRD